MTMKHNNILLLPMLIVSLALSSCGQEKKDNRPIMTYGTYIKTTVNTIKELSSDELYDRLYNKNEVLLLAAYQGDYSKDCACWTTFKNVICYEANYSHYQVYIFNAQEQDESLKDLKIKKINGSTPMLYVFNGPKQLASFSEANKRDKTIFTDTINHELASRVGEYVMPYCFLYYVDEISLDAFIGDKSNSMMRKVFFIRSKCSDCTYTINNVVRPYSEEKNNKQYYFEHYYVFDMQPYYEQEKNSENGEAVYTKLKEKYHLSAEVDEKYGYHKGVVPTAQLYTNGELIYSSVFFNDSISKNENNEYYISDSFYSEERLPYLSYLDDSYNGWSVEHKILKGMKISINDVVFASDGTPYWSQEKAAEYHTPLLRAFLD